MKIKGALKAVYIEGKGGVTLSFLASPQDFCKAGDIAQKLQKEQEKGRTDLNITVEFDRPHRSRDANAYLHVLLNKMAAALNTSMEAVKKEMVLSYGTLMTDEDGDEAFIKLPAAVDISKIYKYTKWLTDRRENGIDYKCYLLYKRTHTLDSAEFGRLLDGVIHEAHALGIETETPDQIAQMLSLMKTAQSS